MNKKDTCINGRKCVINRTVSGLSLLYNVPYTSTHNPLSNMPDYGGSVAPHCLMELARYPNLFFISSFLPLW